MTGSRVNNGWESARLSQPAFPITNDLIPKTHAAGPEAGGGEKNSCPGVNFPREGLTESTRFDLGQTSRHDEGHGQTTGGGLEDKFRVSLYKAFLFLHIMGAIKSGTLNLEHSYKYRSLDDYLISRSAG